MLGGSSGFRGLGSGGARRRAFRHFRGLGHILWAGFWVYAAAGIVGISV